MVTAINVKPAVIKARQSLQQKGLGQIVVVERMSRTEGLAPLKNTTSDSIRVLAERLQKSAGKLLGIKITDIVCDIKGRLAITASDPDFVARVENSGKLDVLGHQVVLEIREKGAGKLYLLKEIKVPEDKSSVSISLSRRLQRTWVHALISQVPYTRNQKQVKREVEAMLAGKENVTLGVEDTEKGIYVFGTGKYLEGSKYFARYLALAGVYKIDLPNGIENSEQLMRLFQLLMSRSARNLLNQSPINVDLVLGDRITSAKRLNESAVKLLGRPYLTVDELPRIGRMKTFITDVIVSLFLSVFLLAKRDAQEMLEDPKYSALVKAAQNESTGAKAVMLGMAIIGIVICGVILNRIISMPLRILWRMRERSIKVPIKYLPAAELAKLNPLLEKPTGE